MSLRVEYPTSIPDAVVLTSNVGGVYVALRPRNTFGGAACFEIPLRKGVSLVHFYLYIPNRASKVSGYECSLIAQNAIYFAGIIWKSKLVA